MIHKQSKRHGILNCIRNLKYDVLIVSLIVNLGMVIAMFSVDSKVAFGQNNEISNEPLRINVQVTNSGGNNEVGSIHIIADETGIVKDSNDISFPSGQTVIKLFEFSLKDIPVGTGFSVEVIYGDDYSKRIHGVSSQTNEPEIIDVVIP